MNTFLRTGEFDAWLADLKDKVWRGSSSASGLPNTAILVIVKQWVPVFPKCASTPAPVTASISRGAERWFICCCCWVVQILAEARHQTRHCDGAGPGKQVIKE